MSRSDLSSIVRSTAHYLNISTSIGLIRDSLEKVDRESFFEAREEDLKNAGRFVGGAALFIAQLALYTVAIGAVGYYAGRSIASLIQ